jgi:hypothetical protein
MMREDRPRTVFPLAIAAVALMLAILPWPYAYYQLLRLGVTAVSVYYAWESHQVGYHKSVWFFGAVALIFNPLVPVYLDRDLWAVIDIALGGTFGVYATILVLRRRAVKRAALQDAGSSGREPDALSSLKSDSDQRPDGHTELESEANGADVPPRGHVLVEDQHGNRFWMDPHELLSGPVISELTSQQVRRIERVKSILSEHDTAPLNETLDRFRRDLNPEREIAVLERVAWLYERELADRPEADKQERVLLYKVILYCSFSRKPGDVVSTVPAAKTLRDIDRVFTRWGFVGANKSSLDNPQSRGAQ